MTHKNSKPLPYHLVIYWWHGSSHVLMVPSGTKVSLENPVENLSTSETGQLTTGCHGHIIHTWPSMSTPTPANSYHYSYLAGPSGARPQDPRAYLAQAGRLPSGPAFVVISDGGLHAEKYGWENISWRWDRQMDALDDGMDGWMGVQNSVREASKYFPCVKTNRFGAYTVELWKL